MAAFDLAPHEHPSFGLTGPMLWVVPYVFVLNTAEGTKEPFVILSNPYGERLDKGEDTGNYIQPLSGSLRQEEWRRAGQETTGALKKLTNVDEAAARLLAFYTGIPFSQKAITWFVDGAALFSEWRSQSTIVAGVPLGTVTNENRLPALKPSPDYKGGVDWLSLSRFLSHVEGEDDATSFNEITKSPFSFHLNGGGLPAFHVSKGVLYIMERVWHRFAGNGRRPKVSEDKFIAQLGEARKILGPSRGGRPFFYALPGFTLGQ